ncbi:MAG: GNAT family N-acetyltransferase [Vicinamibacterales bacterium]
MGDAVPEPALGGELRGGIVRSVRDGRSVMYRFLPAKHDVDAITDLLHRAYAPLAAAGMQFVAAHQTPDVTRTRLSRGDTIVALAGDALIGIVTLARASATSGSPFYDRPDVASFGQFAVEPAWQRAGVGTTLMELVEALASARGLSFLALDTSEYTTDSDSLLHRAWLSLHRTCPMARHELSQRSPGQAAARAHASDL